MVAFLTFIIIVLFVLFVVSNVLYPMITGKVKYFWVFRGTTIVKEVEKLTPAEKLQKALDEFEIARTTLEQVMEEVDEDKAEAEQIVKEAKEVKKQGEKLQKKF